MLRPVTQPPPADPPRKRRLWRWLLGALVLLAALLVWLNGPGLRWLGPLAARHFLAKAGIEASLTIEGNLSHGFAITDVKLSGAEGPLEALTLRRAKPHFRWREIVHGNLDGLTLDGLHADIRLDPRPDEPAADEEPDEKPFALDDLDRIAAAIRDLRQRFLPIALNLTDISLNATKEAHTMINLAPSDLTHRAGEDDIVLRLGAIIDADGRLWPAQETVISWREESISLDRVAPHPDCEIMDLEFHLPLAEAPWLETRVRVHGAVFALASTPGFANAQIALESGALPLRNAAPSYATEYEADATLTSLSLDAENLLPNPLAATATLALTLEDAVYQDWRAEQILLGAVAEAENLHATLQLQALGTGAELEADLALTRSEDSIALGTARGSFRIPAIPALLTSLAEKFPAIAHPAAAPDSTLAGNFTVDLTAGGFHSATLAATLDPADPAQATPVALAARYEPGRPVTGDLTLDGLQLSASFDTEALTYEGKLAVEEFATVRLEPWLDIVAVELPGEAAASATWSGGGDLQAGTHRGTLDLTAGSWQQPDQPALAASASLTYDWPGKVAISALEAVAEDQTITLAAELADDTLTLHRFLWRDGETEIAEGSGALPVPPDLADWRGLLAHDTRPAELAIRTRVLPLELLNPWLPPAARLDTRSTGSLRLNLSGTYASPALDLAIDLRELRSPDNPQLPPADLTLTAKAIGEHLGVDARLTTPGYAPATITASVPFHPRQWAEDPAALTDEILTARVDLPRVDLSRFTQLVPGIRRLGGTVSGNLTAAGPLRKPEARGSIRLERGAITLTSDAVPPIEGLGAEAAFTMDRVTLNNLRATVAGGSLDASGLLTLTPDHQPGNLDFRLRGRSLPLLRNEMLILRANADLRLTGPWDAATISGEVAAVDSVFYRDIELLPIGRPFTTPSAAALPRLDARAVAPGAAASPVPQPIRDWRLGVNVRTQDPFLIRGNLATGRVDVAIRATGTVGDPRLDGAAQLSDVVARLPFSTLTVRRGAVRFTPGGGLDPTLEIRGRAEPRPYQVVLNVYGKASDPQIMLTSSPPLPESEIMTLLATGTTTEGLEDTGAAANRAIQLFAEEVRRGRVPFANRLRPFLGLLDRVDFSLAEKDPYSPDSFSTATISLTDRWYFSAGMSEEGDTRFMGIWRISFK